MRSFWHNSPTRCMAGLTLLLCVLLAGCSSNRWGFPYRVGVQQGNWITQDQVGLLYQGMTREQVRFALGSPTLTSALHASRWDYPYFYRSPNLKSEVRNFSVFFSGDLLVSWSGDEQPTIQPFQIAREEVEKSQAEQAQVDLDAERAQTPSDQFMIAPGVGITMDNPAVISNDPYAAPDEPDAAPEPLR